MGEMDCLIFFFENGDFNNIYFIGCLKIIDGIYMEKVL